VFREQPFLWVVPKKHILFHSHNTRQDKIVSKFVAREGWSVLPI
jgi:hypothetical protein